MKILILACTALLGLLPEPACPQQTPLPEPGVPGVRLAIALTNGVLIAGSNTLLKCWITNNSSSGLVLERTPGEDRPEKYHLEVWLRTEGGKEYVLIPRPGAVRLSRMAESIARGEVRSYRLPLPVPADIPPGRYQLRAKREIHGPGTEVLSNTLDVEVELRDPK
jgi:hypothetical protein